MKGGDFLTGKLKNNTGRNHVVKVRFNDDEYNALCSSARAIETPKARLARELMMSNFKSQRKSVIKLDSADRDKLIDLVMTVLNVENDMLSEFARVGNNLNQLTKMAHTYESMSGVTPEQLAELDNLLRTCPRKLLKLDEDVSAIWQRLV